MNRYYPYNDNLGNFMAGLGQRGQQVQDQENALRFQSQQQLQAAIGQGVSNFNVGMMARSNQLQDDARNFQQQSSLLNQRGQQAQALQGNAMLSDELNNWNFGAQKQATTGGMSPMTVPADTGVGTMMDGSTMQPEQAQPPIQPTMPLPSLDPAFTKPYQQAMSNYQDLVMRRDKIVGDASMPAQEKAILLNQMRPQAAQAYSLLTQYQQPKPPTTEDELIQSGMVIPANGGGRWYKSGPDKLSYAAPDSKTSPVQLPWKTPEEKMAHFEANHVGPVDPDAEYLWDGNSWTKVKDDKGKGGKAEDYGKNVPSVKFERSDEGKPLYDPRTQEDLANAAVLERNAAKIVEIKDVAPRLIIDAQQGDKNIVAMNEMLQDIAILYPNINDKSVDPDVRKLARDLDYYLTYRGE